MNTRFWFSKQGLGAAALIIFTSYFLLMEHRAHLFQALPFLIILLCPLMHMFMHSGHGNHSHTTDSSDDGEQAAFQRGLDAGRREAGAVDKTGGNDHAR
ncbi:DUF2933 domain-containing protein [Allohahella marinimesophila]|uniref:DUF2933 domain-containing protein n=1 Tax=Allohahella marinimesophila TaxID=1054972 RepID=A0ABP7Q6G5_9GAMM